MNIGIDPLYFGMRYGSLKAEMDNFDDIRRTDAEKSKQMFQTGTELVRCCENGELSKLRRLLQGTPSSDVLIYCKYVDLS